MSRTVAVPGAPTLLLVGFTAAVALRVALGGAAVARSAPAGLVFAVALLVLAAAAGRPRLRLTVGTGLLGAATAGLLCLPVLLTRGAAEPPPDGWAAWAAVVAVVAAAEEALLRGTLYEQVAARRGAGAAVLVGAVAFALLHVPLYGWTAVPLDLVVGLLLGELRRGTGGWGPPAVAHVLADWAAWWLR